MPSKGCSWAKHFIPVEGWQATKRRGDRYGTTYNVEYCPQYENDSCYIKKDRFWGECTGDCYSCAEWRDSEGHKMQGKGKKEVC